MKQPTVSRGDACRRSPEETVALVATARERSGLTEGDALKLAVEETRIERET